MLGETGLLREPLVRDGALHQPNPGVEVPHPPAQHRQQLEGDVGLAFEFSQEVRALHLETMRVFHRGHRGAPGEVVEHRHLPKEAARRQLRRLFAIKADPHPTFENNEDAQPGVALAKHDFVRPV